MTKIHYSETNYRTPYKYTIRIYLNLNKTNCTSLKFIVYLRLELYETPRTERIVPVDVKIRCKHYR